jgi:hypothetical protein
MLRARRPPEGRRHARQGRDPIQFLPATLSHTQSTLSPRHVEYSVHVQFHVRGSTCSWTSWTPWRSTSKGVTKGMVEMAGGWFGR